MKKQYAVIGMGTFGTALAETLIAHGQEVLAIDLKHQRVQELSDIFDHVVQADARDPKALKALGIDKFDAVIVSLGDKVADTIFLTLTLKELGVETVIVTTSEEQQGKVLEKIGASKIVAPVRDMGERVALSLLNTRLTDYIELAPGYMLVETALPAKFAGKDLKELNLRAKYKVTVIVIKRQDTIMINPEPDIKFQAEDNIVLLGDSKKIQQCVEDFS